MRNTRVISFKFGMPSPEKMDELFLYMQSEPAAYEFLVEVWRANGLDPGEISAAISKFKRLAGSK